MLSEVEHEEVACRFTLTRTLREPACSSLLWVMLNPSTADEHIDDPTIRRVMSFTERFGADRVVVANLYAQRATKPKDLVLPPALAIEAMNIRVLRNLVRDQGQVVCAWGAHDAAVGPGIAFYGLCQHEGVRTMCLGTTKSGAPRHPLYVKSATNLTSWEPTDAD